ncbi:hypothetical protein MNB_ARC-1_1078 [hydrothermal vent metagenome]|uniref:Uncharacterized protein n=1 Tax=hydrothermal vent metagenome TaxID=652676 RepID=A0A3B1E702_9ZZZZ
MNYKLQRFIENIIIVSVLIGFIYGVFVLFISFIQGSSTNVQHSIPKIIKKPKNLNINKVVNLEKNISEIIKKDIITTQLKTIISETNDTIVDNVKDNKTIMQEKDINQNITIEKAKQQFFNKKRLNKFLKTLKNLINNAIDKSVQTTSLDIRITILDNGNLEKVTYVGGDKLLFDENKDIIIGLFPVDIHEDIKNQFPRYFRMTIKYNK